ncbi:MAG: hypothetical protein J5892_02570 [Bacilli bacterium]|nr:hypothetical protein [Bacilli bacterium]
MKESIGTSYLFQIVVVFVLLFTGYLCLSINYARSFAVKNNIVNNIQREKGFNDITRKKISRYLSDVGFKSTGRCPDGYNAYNADGTLQGDGKTGIYCVKKVITAPYQKDIPQVSYYRVVVFYKLDLPIFSAVFRFKNFGDTYLIGDLNQG